MKPSKINFGSSKPGGSIFNKNKKAAKVHYKSDTPNIEDDAVTELTALQIAFREKAAQEKALQDQNVEGDYFSVIVFKNQAQRDRFYELLGVKEDDLQYVNGDKLIKALELKIEEVNQKTPGRFKCNKEILNLSINPFS